jgi:hypothetical protein
MSESTSSTTSETPPTTTSTTSETPPPESTSTNGTSAETTGDSLETQIERLNVALREERRGRTKLEAQLEEERRKGLSDQERAIAEARSEAIREERERWQTRLVAAEVRAAAAGRLADPDDARLADLSSVTIDDEGVIDRKGIESALEALVKAKPHLAKPTGPATPKAPAGVRTETPGESVDSWLRSTVRGRGS